MACAGSSQLVQRGGDGASASAPCLCPAEAGREAAAAGEIVDAGVCAGAAVAAASGVVADCATSAFFLASSRSGACAALLVLSYSAAPGACRFFAGSSAGGISVALVLRFVPSTSTSSLLRCSASVTRSASLELDTSTDGDQAVGPGAAGAVAVAAAGSVGGGVCFPLRRPLLRRWISTRAGPAGNATFS